MIKTNLWGTVLAGALALAALVTAWSFFSFQQYAKSLHALQAQVTEINVNRTRLQGLLTEALEYTKRDPTLEPLLQSMGVRFRTNTPPPSSSAKPASK
jgi:hypothetical protein